MYAKRPPKIGNREERRIFGKNCRKIFRRSTQITPQIDRNCNNHKKS